MKRGVLLLSHCGFSLIEDLARSVAEQGLERYILSSSPLPLHADRLRTLAEHAEWIASVPEHELKHEDVLRALAALRERGAEVVCCMSVWEGYRELTARANQSIGAPDITVDQVALVRDKLRLRNALHARGLSRVRAELLTRERLACLRESGYRYFVKPLRGIASYGAFPLRDDTTWEKLEAIARDSESDAVYRSVLGAGSSFIAEEYIVGRECSFEVLCVEGRRFVVAVHEKVGLREEEATVLEDACASPPWNLDAAALGAGVRWIDDIFAALSFDWGCWHVEGRFDGARWEIIEINPRIGGALISASVRALTGGASLLDIWVRTALSGDAAVRDATVSVLERAAIAPNGETPGKTATFFRVYFAQPGRIADVRSVPIEPPPMIEQLFLHAGDEVNESAREVFLGQLLWTYPREEHQTLGRFLFEASSRALEVSYAVPLEAVS